MRRSLTNPISLLAWLLLVIMLPVGNVFGSDQHDSFVKEWLLPLGEYTTAQPQSARCRLFIREVGQGPTVVVLHGGWGGEHRSIMPGLLPLARDYRLVFYDQRGSLRSPCDELPVVSDHVADLEGLRVALSVERIVILGHSMGGWLAQAYAAEHPENVAGLILVSTVPARHDLPRRTDEVRWNRPEVLQELRRQGLELDRQPEESFQEWSTNHRIIFAAVNLHDVTNWREVPIPWFHAGDAGRSAAASMPKDYDFTDELRSLDVPILAVAGDDDYIPISSQKAWTSEVPNATLAVIENAGHLAWIDRPYAVLDQIDVWLARLHTAIEDND